MIASRHFDLATRLSVLTCIVATAVALAPLAARADDEQSAGQRTFVARCASCHGTTPGEKKFGPTLAGVFGRASGSVDGFKYSLALKNAHLTWDSATLDKWLAGPIRLVHGTTMFLSVPSSSDRQNLIAYLKTLSSGTHTSPPPGKGD